MNRKLISLLIIVIIIVTAVLSFNCETGVEDSPTPGIIRVKLQADLSDTVLVERSDTFAVNLKYPAIFMIKSSKDGFSKSRVLRYFTGQRQVIVRKMRSIIF